MPEPTLERLLHPVAPRLPLLRAAGRAPKSPRES